MRTSKLLQVFEHEKLCIGGEFKETHLTALATYLTKNEACGFYTLLYNGVRFTQYVGVIQVDDLTIEVLPKTDRHNLSESNWHDLLIDMLKISLHVQAKATTIAAIRLKKLSVLDAYLLMFLDEVAKLLHGGLVKKYRKIEGNQTALKGRLLFNKHVTKNVTHAERFYVSYTTYDKNNIYNTILYKALNTITNLYTSSEVSSKCRSILFDFPECDDVRVSQNIFDRLRYDRKTNNYKKAIELARIILLNYHPDFRGGRNNILAIMVDMNELWENYVYFVLNNAAKQHDTVSIQGQAKTAFWQQPNGYHRKLKPDLLITGFNGDNIETVVLDTKWKYQSEPSIEDVRQMYAYGHYFDATRSYLLYPDKIKTDNKVSSLSGVFNPTKAVSMGNQECGLFYIDPIIDSSLNNELGNDILRELKMVKGQ